MELYDKKYVYFEWDKELEGKKGFFANTINELKAKVENGFELLECHFSNNHAGFHFSNSISNSAYQFFYYDPYYEYRRAYNEGKQIQFKDWNDDWVDVAGEPLFKNGEYRIKPINNTYCAVWNANAIYCDVNTENKSRVLFSSYKKEEVEHFIETHQYLNEIIKGWFEGKTVQFRDINSGEDESWNTMKFDNDLSGWDFVHYEYRIEPSEDKYVPFDTVQELIDCWDSKHPSNINRPSDTMPLIWIKSRKDGSIYLITEFYPKKYNDIYDVSTTDGFLSFEKLFCDFTFLDDSIIGKVEE